MESPGPIAFTIGTMEIRWYGILIATGAMLATLLAYKRAPKRGIQPDDVLDLVLWTLPIGIIGARVYYVIFSWNTLYRYNPMEAFNIREGGLAIHGGLIFGLVTAWAICRTSPFYMHGHNE